MSSILGAQDSEQATADTNLSAYRDGVHCTAGINYAVIAPNGCAYHCMTDLEANAPPAFNLLTEGWAPKKGLQRCPYAVCSGCDEPYITRWIQDGAGKTLEVFARQWPMTKPIIAEYPQSLNSVSKSLTWLPSQICNHTCVYCDYGNGKAFTHQRYPMSKTELNVVEWLQVWSNILEHVDYAAVSISGGEPTLSPALVPVLSLLSSRFLTNVTTNGSQNMLQFARQITPKRTIVHPILGNVDVGLDQINMSLHPSSRSFDQQVFRGNALMLKNVGFNVMVNYVGYPPQLFLAGDHKKWCEDNEIPFMLLEWGGGDRLGNLATYTRRERAFFDALVTQDRRVNACDTPIASQEITVDTRLLRVSRNEPMAISGKIRNLSSFDWIAYSHLGVKIGARLFPSPTGDDSWRERLNYIVDGPLRDLRCGLPNSFLAQGEQADFSFEIPVSDLSVGCYRLIIDAVDEGKYWFADIGSTPEVITIYIT